MNAMKRVPTAIQSSLVMYVLREAESGDMDSVLSLLESGFTTEQIDNLRNMPAADVARLIKSNKPLFNISVNPDNLNLALDTKPIQEQQNEALVDFIKRGASISMTRRYFKVGRNDITELRQIYDITHQPGRQPMPPVPLREAIVRHWYDAADLPERERLLAVHDLINRQVTLAAVFAVISADAAEE